MTAPDRLGELVTAAFGAGATVGGRRPFPYATSHPIEEAVVVTPTETLEVLVKGLDPAALVEEARGVPPEFLVDPLREPDVYRMLLPGAPPGTPAVYAGGSDVLVLERVAGIPLWEVGDLAVWHQAARWLARFHAARLDRRGPPATSRLLRYDRRHYDRWLPRVESNLQAAGAVSGGASRLSELYPRLVEELLAMPATMVHGEFYASNVLVSFDREPPRICPVDWEMAAVGPPLVDLAALTAGWDGATAGALTASYRDEAGPASAPAGAAFDRALDACRLSLCVRWLGWAPGWTPPAEHGRDWLGDALSIADRLGL